MAQETNVPVDTFQSDEDDSVRLYGATNASSPIQGKLRPPEVLDDKEPTQETSDSHAVLLSSRPHRDIYSDARMGSIHSINSTYSDETSITTKTFPGDVSWWHHPKVRQNWKIVLACLFLTVFGTALVVVGVVVQVTNVESVQSFIFFIAGAICLIPGAYHVVYIYCAVKGRKGFNFYNMPHLK